MGWIVPRPSSLKGDAELRREREEKVGQLSRVGLLRSERLRRAMLTVRREDFVPAAYRDYTYEELPIPLPGRSATVSCPHSYPLFYEALGLAEGHRFLEVGLGSGYGAALAREVVGPAGLVVSVEIDPDTLAFASPNLERAGYADVVRVRGDGGEGWPPLAPYDRICVTAACPDVPAPLLAQLQVGGRLIMPLKRDSRQELTLLEKTPDGFRTSVLTEVLYVDLQGRHGPPGSVLRPALVVTWPGPMAGRRTRRCLRRALPEADVRRTGFRAVLCVFAPGDPVLLADRASQACRGAVGRITAVLAQTTSERAELLQAARSVALEQVGPDDSFAFRVHKRGAHGYVDPTPELESDVGGQVADALERRDGKPPRVDLTDPDVLVSAEVLGTTTLVGVVRRAWLPHSRATTAR